MRPGGDDRDVHRCGPEPGTSQSRDDLAQQRTAGDPPRRRGIGRKQATQVPQPGGTQEGVRHGVQGDVSVRVAVEAWRTRDLDSAEAQRHAGTERMTVVAKAGPRRQGRQGLLDPTQVLGQRHLEVHGFTGDCMDRDGTGLEQSRLISELRRAVRRERHPCVEQQPAPRALRRLGRRERRPVQRLVHQAIPHALQRLDHGHHGDRRSMTDGGGGHRFDERSRHEWPRPVVDQDRPVATSGIHELQVADASGHRNLPGGPAAHHRIDARRQPWGGRHGVHAIRGRDDDHSFDDRRGRERRQGPREQRTPRDGDHQLVGAAHPARGARGNDHDVHPGALARSRGHPSPGEAGRRSSARPPSGGRG